MNEGDTRSRIAPHSIEAERSVLGAILVKNDTIHTVLECGIESRDFYKPAHQRIFDTLHSLSHQGAGIDLVTLTSGLKDRGWYEEVGGNGALTELFQDAFAVGNVTYYAKIIREKALVRRMIEVAGEINEAAFDGVENVEEFLDSAEQKVFAVSDTNLRKSVESAREILLKNMQVIEERMAKKAAITGLATGFHEIDRLTCGLQPGQLVIVASRPAMGKTSLVLSLVQNAALQNGAVALIFSLEMSKEELMFKMLSGVAKIRANAIKTGRIEENEWTKLIQAADSLSKARVHMDDSGTITVMDIRARARRLLATEKRLDIIVVDYLQLMKGSMAQKGFNREQEISEISRSLKGLAKELKVPILALSQLSRQVENRPDKRPGLSDLRESGAIEQDADIVAFIYRDEYYNPDTEDKGVAEIIVAKHRAGETATVKLAWLHDYTLFANLVREGDMPMPVLRRPQGNASPGSDMDIPV